MATKTRRSAFVATAVLAAAVLAAPVHMAPTSVQAASLPRHVVPGGGPVTTPGNAYVLPGAAVYPESIGYQPSTGAFFVGSSADGTIYRGTLDHPTTAPFLAAGTGGRTSAIGVKVDTRGRLFVAGGATGRLFVYNAASGSPVGTFSTGTAQTFVNDIATLPNGDAYVTDSFYPELYKLTSTPAGLVFSPWLDLSSMNPSPIQYGPGFNLNGIAGTADGRYLITVQTNSGQLFRIDTATKEVRAIDLGVVQTVLHGDGILLDGHTLYVVRNADGLIVQIQLSPDYLSGLATGTFSSPSFAYPTAIAKTGSTLLVVNSQFDKQGPGLMPVIPFTVVRYALPSVPLGQ